MVGSYGKSRNRWASDRWAVPGLHLSRDVVAWVIRVPRDASLHVACGLCLPLVELVNGLCYHFVMKDHVMRFPLQVIYFCAFHSDGEGRKRTSSTCSNESLNAGGTPVTPRRVSWRQRIFLRVASPMRKSPSAMQQGSFASHLPLTTIVDSEMEGVLFVQRELSDYGREVTSLFYIRASGYRDSHVSLEPVRHTVNAVEWRKEGRKEGMNEFPKPVWGLTSSCRGN